MDLLQFCILSLVFLFLFLLPTLTKKLFLQTTIAATNLPPGPWKLPIIGSLHHLIGDLPHHRLSRLAKTYGPLLHLKLGEVNLIAVTSPELARDVMKTHDISFAYRPPLLAGKLIFYNSTDIVFSPYGNYLGQLRKICSMNILSARRVKSFGNIRLEEGDILVKKIRAASEAGSSVNITELFLSAAYSMIAKTVFGKKNGQQGRFFIVMREIMRLSSGFVLVDIFPSMGFLGRISGLKAEMERAHREADEILNNIITEHLERDGGGGDGMDDLVDALLLVRKHGDSRFPLSLNNVKAVILNLFIGGTDTTSGTLVWAMVELIRHPEIMKKAQSEVREAYREKRKMTEEIDTTKLQYLNHIIKETIRLHSVTPLLVPRVCHEAIELSGYTIPAGSRVVINARAIMRDPKIWANPESFEPERFEDNPLEFKGDNFEYTPFGSGRRMCVGISFAKANIEQWLAQLLFYFNWGLPQGMKAKDVDMEESFGATVVKKNALHLIATPYEMHGPDNLQ